MTGPKLKDIAISQLVSRFSENGIAQADALLYSEIKKLNRLVRQMWAITDELEARGEEAQLRLLSLYDHPNVQVRLQAARETLSVAPVAARGAIEVIANSKDFPQAGDAGMTLDGLDGKFREP